MTCQAMYPFDAPDSDARRRPFSVAVHSEWNGALLNILFESDLVIPIHERMMKKK